MNNNNNNKIKLILYIYIFLLFINTIRADGISVQTNNNNNNANTVNNANNSNNNRVNSNNINNNLFKVYFNHTFQIELINQERERHNVSKVVESPCLMEAAQSHSKYMATLSKLTQDSLEGDLLALLKSFGVSNIYYAAINLGGGYFSDIDFLNGLSTQRDNIENMLNPDVSLIGIGMFKNQVGIPYWTQLYSTGKCQIK